MMRKKLLPIGCLIALAAAIVGVRFVFKPPPAVVITPVLIQSTDKTVEWKWRIVGGRNWKGYSGGNLEPSHETIELSGERPRFPFFLWADGGSSRADVHLTVTIGRINEPGQMEFTDRTDFRADNGGLSGSSSSTTTTSKVPMSKVV